VNPLLVLRDGKVLARQAGAAPLPVLRTWLDDAIGGAATATGSDETGDRR